MPNTLRGMHANTVLAILFFLIFVTAPVALGQQSLPSVDRPQGGDTPQKPEIAVNAAPPPPSPAKRPMSDMERFRSARQTNQLLSSTIDTDHENAGVMTERGGPYRGIFAVHPVYPTGSVHLKLPQGATRTQILYAATTRPPNGSCLEMGTAYTTNVNSTQTNVSIYVYDFCKPGGGDWAIPPMPTEGMVSPIVVDEQFMNTYGKAQAGDIHSSAYAISIFTPDLNISSHSKWYAQLFNYKTGQWETKYTTQGSFPDDERGWSIFETYFQEGLCSESLPQLGAEQISLFNAITKTWEPISNKLQDLPVKVSHGGEHNHNCFVADSTGPASYVLGPEPPIFTWWSVSSR